MSISPDKKLYIYYLLPFYLHRLKMHYIYFTNKKEAQKSSIICTRAYSCQVAELASESI